MLVPYHTYFIFVLLVEYPTMLQKQYIFLVSLIFSIITIKIKASEIEGTVQFPIAIESLGAPIIRGGTSLRVNVEGNLLTFSTKWSSKQTTIDLVIVEPKNIKHHLKSIVDSGSLQNTINYRTIITDRPYKYFQMSIMPKKSIAKQNDSSQWHIEETKLTNNIIPDDAIIFLYNPNYIKTVRPDGIHKLPTIIIEPNVISLAGSLDFLHEQEVVNLFAGLDLNPIHPQPKQMVQFKKNCNCVINYIG